jgi:hypothetical protein
LEESNGATDARRDLEADVADGVVAGGAAQYGGLPLRHFKVAGTTRARFFQRIFGLGLGLSTWRLVVGDFNGFQLVALRTDHLERGSRKGQRWPLVSTSKKRKTTRGRSKTEPAFRI